VNRDNCGSWALSFFETEKHAEDRLKYFTNDKPFLFKFLGNHIATGTLDKLDGISEDCDENGHFNHHEYTGANFTDGKFKITKKVA
jgi:hypothetical protein